MNLIDELEWRGLLHDLVPGTKELLEKEKVKGYIGFDPTADSLHIGNLVPIMLLVHLQRHGHTPFALVGGATGMVGDPSGKSAERNLLDEKTLNKNVAAVKQQLMHFLQFDNVSNPAQLVNNYDWFKDFSFLGFIRDIGKHLTINYMTAKDSVKKRLETGLSFTEFSYQLVQGYDFYHLYKNEGCVLQMGGSDQWGNMTTGMELIRRMDGGDAYVVTCPLITKADGSKFGKSEDGNVWLDANKTSPYKFYQFWLNVSDEDAAKFIKIYTLLNKEEVASLEEEHENAPHKRVLQQAIAKEVTIRVHGEAAYDAAVEASQILFGKGTQSALKKLDKETLLDVFDGVPQSTVALQDIKDGCNVIDLSTAVGVFGSKGEARRMIQGGGLSVNQEKVSDIESIIDANNLIADQYVLLKKGKKNYYLLIAE